MGTLKTTYSHLSRQAEYQNGENIFINVNYEINEPDRMLVSINGTLYKGEDREYAGRFDGRLENGEITYNMSGVKLSDMTVLYAAITDIEEIIAEEFPPIND